MNADDYIPHTTTSTGTDMLCAYCGKPIIGANFVAGNAGFYHHECVRGHTSNIQCEIAKEITCPHCKKEIIFKVYNV